MTPVCKLYHYMIGFFFNPYAKLHILIGCSAVGDFTIFLDRSKHAFYSGPVSFDEKNLRVDFNEI